MPNGMATLLNIGGALCSMPQSLYPLNGILEMPLVIISGSSSSKPTSLEK